MALGGHASPAVGDFSVAFLVVAGVALLSLPVVKQVIKRGTGIPIR